MQFGGWGILFLFGALQALLFIVGTILQPGKRTLRQRLLIGMLLCISIILVHHALFISSDEGTIWRYRFIGFSAAAWISVIPSYYLYGRSTLEADFQWRKAYWWFYVIPLYHLLSWGWNFVGLRIGFYLLFADRLWLYNYLWIASYLMMALIFVVKFQREMSVAIPEGLNWLRWGNQLFLLCLLIAIAVFSWMVWADQYSEQFEFSLLLLFEAFVLMLALRSIRGTGKALWLGHQRYGNAALKHSALQLLEKRLAEYVRKERPYLNATLQLQELANGVGATEQELSQLFTRHLGTSFYDYINAYRLSAFEAACHSEDARRLTVVALAEQCGFKSKSSFYRVFRDKHQTTPSAFLKSLQ